MSFINKINASYITFASLSLLACEKKKVIHEDPIRMDFGSPPTVNVGEQNSPSSDTSLESVPPPQRTPETIPSHVERSLLREATAEDGGLLHVFFPSRDCRKNPADNFWGCKVQRTSYDVSSLSVSENKFLQSMPFNVKIELDWHCNASQSVYVTALLGEEKYAISEETKGVLIGVSQKNRSVSFDVTVSSDTTVGKSCNISLRKAVSMANFEIIEAYIAESPVRGTEDVTLFLEAEIQRLKGTEEEKTVAEFLKKIRASSEAHPL